MNGSKDSLHGVDLDAALDRAERDAAGRRLRAAGAALRPDPAFARQLEDRLLRDPTPVTPPPRRWRLPALAPRRLGVAATGLLAALVLAAAAAPVLMPLLDQVFARNARTQRVDGRQLGRDLNLSQTANGFTVTVGRVYADANEITIGYTVTGPPGRDYVNIAVRDAAEHGAPTLIDARGQRLKVAPSQVETRVQGEQQAGLMHYETAEIAGAPAALALQWTVGALRVTERSNPAGAYYIPGPFVFDFTVPFELGRTLELNQSVEVGGTTVTLERVVATPVSTRVYLRGAGPNAQVELTVDGTTHALQEPGGPPDWAPDSTWYYLLPEPLLDKRGDWTLVVRTRTPAPARTVPGGAERPLDRGGPERTTLQGGPWTFHFRWSAETGDPR